MSSEIQKLLTSRDVGEIESSDGGKDFRWVRVTEHGADGSNLHFHVLIGGLRKGTATRWVSRWNAIAGEAKVEQFNPDEDGIFYILKGFKLGRDFEIEVHFPVVSKARRNGHVSAGLTTRIP